MLSYRHAYHAGNHADVLKHTALLLVLDYLTRKDTPVWYIDTHAGAGSYRLQDEAAQKTREFETGVARLWARPDLPAALARYVDAVRAGNTGAELLRYPGSPVLAAEALRAQDRLRLFELHPRDHDTLATLFARDRRVQVAQADGLKGLKALLPPPSRRALVLIDPPYELESEYRQVVAALKDALQRFATGTYMLWYPLLDQAESKRLPARLAGLKCAASLRAEFTVRAPTAEFGLYGSGVFVINPPWTLAASLRELLPWLVGVLGEDVGAGWRLESTGD